VKLRSFNQEPKGRGCLYVGQQSFITFLIIFSARPRDARRQIRVSTGEESKSNIASTRLVNMTSRSAMSSTLALSNVAGFAAITDSPDEVRLRASRRERVPVTSSSWRAVVSAHPSYNPKVRAAVETTENWSSYVTVHAYTPEGHPKAVAGGVKRHRGLSSDREAYRPSLQADKGIWRSL
jgi:hypothetical protein